MKHDSESSTGLARNTVSAVQIAVVSVAASGPATGIALVLPAMAGFAGKALVFAFVFTLGAVLLLTNTFVEFSKRLPSAGSLLAWNSAGLGTSVGFVFGWFFVGAYMTVAATGFAAFGGYAHDFLESTADVNIPWWVLTAVCMAYVITLAWRGITQSVESALILLAAEVGVCVLLALWLLLSGDADLQWAPLNPGSSSGGWAAIGLALTYGILSMVGYEEAATLAEEAKDTRRTVARGLWIAAIATPLFFIFVSYMLVTSYGSITRFAADPLAAQTLATKAWGSPGKVITVVVILSCAAIAQTVFNAGVRVIYSIGRTDLLPRAFARTHAKHKTPGAAILLFGAVTFVLTMATAGPVGPLKVFSYFGFMTAVMFLIIYALTNVALIRFIRRDHPGEFSIWRHALLPLGGVAAVLYPLYRTVHPLPDSPLPMLLCLVGVWALVGVGLLAYVRSSGKADVEKVTRAFAAAD